MPRYDARTEAAVLILFDDGVCEELGAEKVRGDWYRLTDTALATSTEARRGDVIELAEEGKIWRFRRVVERAATTLLELTLPQNDPEWSSLRSLFDHLEKVGGEWERACGGVVFLHVPTAHAEEVRKHVAEIVG